MRLLTVLGGLLLGSAVTLGIGGVILFIYNLVPNYLIELTAAVVIALVPLSYYVIQGNELATNVSTTLGIIAPISSIVNQVHVAVLLSFGQSLLISVLGLLQFLGFYLFPIAFVVLRIVYRKKIPLYPKADKEPLGKISSTGQSKGANVDND